MKTFEVTIPFARPNSRLRSLVVQIDAESRQEALAEVYGLKVTHAQVVELDWQKAHAEDVS